MKKRILCGSAAILMTGLTVSVFTTAEPRTDREPSTLAVAPRAIVEDVAIERGEHLIAVVEVLGSRHAS